MRKFSLFLLLFFVSQVSLVLPQSTAGIQVETKVIKWELLYGSDNEFALMIPQGYKGLSESDFFTGKSLGKLSKIDKKLLVYRYINGVVLIMEFYEGDAKDLLKGLIEKSNSPDSEIREINGFDFAEIEKTENKMFEKKQFFRIKNRLYVLRAISDSENNPIASGFFKSVKLITDGKSIFPNVASDVKKFELPNLIEKQPEKVIIASADESEEVDREVIVLQMPRPIIEFSKLGNVNSVNVKVKVLYSATGEVSDVKVVESNLSSVNKAVIDAAKQTVFLPAEKDGKLISVHKTQSFSVSKSSQFF